jgi:hypothetical protein
MKMLAGKKNKKREAVKTAGGLKQLKSLTKNYSYKPPETEAFFYDPHLASHSSAIVMLIRTISIP